MTEFFVQGPDSRGEKYSLRESLFSAIGTLEQIAIRRNRLIA
jgi:hypothetical protein